MTARNLETKERARAPTSGRSARKLASTARGRKGATFASEDVKVLASSYTGRGERRGLRKCDRRAGRHPDVSNRRLAALYLFWDTPRQRADNMVEHERAGLLPLLDFKYETILDARRFDHPLIQKERELIDQVAEEMGTARKARDGAYEQMFGLVFGELRVSDPNTPSSTQAEYACCSLSG